MTRYPSHESLALRSVLPSQWIGPLPDQRPAASWDPDRYLDAYRFAARAHQGQYVPGVDQFPYILHVSSVAMEVCAALSAERFPEPDVAVQCALLHDVIEDTPVTYGEVEAHFGPEVARGVLALTKDETLSKPDAMADSLARIRLCPREVWIVKLADRITNLQKPPAKWSTEKRLYYVEEAEVILSALGAASTYLRERMTATIQRYRENWCTPA